jgi:hypothetical protein
MHGYDEENTRISSMDSRQNSFNLKQETEANMTTEP